MPLPELIRIKEVCALTSLSQSEIYELAKRGTFPKQRRLSHKVAVWVRREVQAWIDGVVERAA